MESELDPMREAERRIAEEAVRRSGVLDLSGLGLPALPESVFGLTHLEDLSLGQRYGHETNKILGAFQDIASQARRLAALTALRRLSLSGTDLDDVAPLAALNMLQSLDLTNTQVSDC